MERQRKTQARHIALLSSDAPVMNRCAKEEAHLKQRLAQSTAALTRSTQQSHAAAEREQRSRDALLHSQLTAVLADTPEIAVPSPAALGATVAADGGGNDGSVGWTLQPAAASLAAANRRGSPSRALAATQSAATSSGPARSSSASLLGFPEPFSTSGFKSAVHWASVAYDETFLTAYGPRSLREASAASVANPNAIMEADDSAAAVREAKPHRLMAAVACYLLNEVLCADTAVSALWQEKLRQPIFDAVFSSQSIAAGQERQKQGDRGSGKAVNEAVHAQAIVERTLGAAASRASLETEEREDGGGGAVAASSPLPEPPFPPRANTYDSREDYATMRLWIEELSAEHREKALVCRRAQSLYRIMERRMHLLQVYQKQTNVAAQRAIFTVWRTHTRHCRARRAAMERYLENRHHRVLEENVFLRWRRVTLQSKVESLQRRMLNIVADREEAARQHAVTLSAAEEQRSKELRQHQQALAETEALHTQVLESHGLEVEALRLVLHQQRAHTAEVGRWARRWERLAKTFRPVQLHPRVPSAMWSATRALYAAEEAMVAKVLGKGGDRRVLQLMTYTVLLPVRERLEQLLLAWVNAVMECSPVASSWVRVETFLNGRASQPRSILVPQKTASGESSRQAESSSGADSYLSEFGVYTLMSFVRELRRLYILSGKMPDSDAVGGNGAGRLPRGGGAAGAGMNVGGGRTSLAKCFREVVQLLTVQTCAGLYPSLLTHCPTLTRWFNAEGIFGGPLRGFEGAGKERRLQHSMFVWLLTALLVGHIRLTLLAPAGERDDGLPPPPPAVSGARPSRESDISDIPQLHFPVDAAVAAGPDSSAAGSGGGAQGSSIVAQSTLLPKKSGGKGAAKAAKAPRVSSPPRRELGSASKDTGTFVMQRVVTLEAALRERRTQPGAAPIDADDSLSDIESYLGLAPTQSAGLRLGGEGNATGTRGETHNAAAAGDGNAGEALVDGLLQQLVQARDAAAQTRRAQRMQLESDHVSAASHSPAAQTEEARLYEAQDSAADGESDGEEGSGIDLYSDDGGEGRSGDDDDDAAAAGDASDASAADVSNAVSGASPPRSTVALTPGQLRVLRMLPSRSTAFDAARPGAAASPPGSAHGPPSRPGTSGGAAAAVVAAEGQPNRVYSFLLNTLEDVTRRQQWAGMARVVTSLVVRFHILDDVEDGFQRSQPVAPAREEAAREEAQARPPSTTSSRRPPPVAPTAQSARLPAVAGAGSREGSATVAAKKAAAPDRQRGAGAETARERSRGERVAARLVPAGQSAMAAAAAASTPPPPSSLRVGVARVGEDLPGSAVSFADTAPSVHGSSAGSQRQDGGDAAAASPPLSKHNSVRLLGGHEMRTLAAEVRMRVPRGSVATSQRSSISARESAGPSLAVAPPPTPGGSAPPPVRPTTSPSTAAAWSEGGGECSTLASRRGDDDDDEEAAEVDSRKEGEEVSPHAYETQPHSTSTSPAHSEPRMAGAKTCQGDEGTAMSAASPSSLPYVSPRAVTPPASELADDVSAAQQRPSSAVTPSPLSGGPASSSRGATPQTAAVPPEAPRLQASPHSPAPPPLPLSHPQHRGNGLPSSPARQPPILVGSVDEVMHAGPQGGAAGGGFGSAQEEMGLLDPLIEHGLPQSSAAMENIRKYRFRYQQ